VFTWPHASSRLLQVVDVAGAGEHLGGARHLAAVLRVGAEATAHVNGSARGVDEPASPLAVEHLRFWGGVEAHLLHDQ